MRPLLCRHGAGLGPDGLEPGLPLAIDNLPVQRAGGVSATGFGKTHNPQTCCPCFVGQALRLPSLWRLGSHPHMQHSMRSWPRHSASSLHGTSAPSHPSSHANQYFSPVSPQTVSQPSPPLRHPPRQPVHPVHAISSRTACDVECGDVTQKKRRRRDVSAVSRSSCWTRHRNRRRLSPNRQGHELASVPQSARHW